MKHDELKIQIECVKYLSSLGYICIHPANERAMGIADVKRMQSAGVLKGVPDLICFKNGQTLFVEVKTSRGVLSIEQLAFQEWALNQPNTNYYVTRSIEQLKEQVK